ncbi:uncharacterized protein LOC135939251 [Cloeon dipterum]|uniref:uncharacterized protein LOC135939251 n=1 Tax=Cloeon dipterum TaxID=197152 RepID=UPI00321FA8B1
MSGETEKLEKFLPADKPALGITEKKRRALEMGENTDCAFLVGPDDEMAEVIHASKFDLVSSSEFFKAMMRSPLTQPGPIRIRQLEPRIFKMVLEYVHLHHLSTKPIDLEDAIQLARAADEYLIDDLATLCSKIVEGMLTVDKVWKVANENHTVKCVANGCIKILTEETCSCLDHESFLEIREDTVIWFLTLPEMNIETETTVINACLKYCRSRIDMNLMRTFIPHLRLLTLSCPDELMLISEYLSSREAKYISYKMLLANDKKKMKLMLPQSLCPIIEERCNKKAKYETLVLIPDTQLIGSQELIEQKLYEKITKNVDSSFFPTCYLIFQAKKYMVLKQVEVLCKVQIEPMFINNKWGRVVFDTNEEYNSNIMMDASVMYNATCKNYKPVLKGVFRTSSSVRFDFVEPFFVPKGAVVKLRTFLKEDCYYRRILIKTVQEGLAKWDDQSPKDVFDNFRIFYSDDGKTNQNGVCFFKNLVYTLIEV